MKAFRKVRSEALVSSWQQRVATMTRMSMIASSLTAIATAFVAALPSRAVFADRAGQNSKTPGGGYTCSCPINALCGNYFSCNPLPCCHLGNYKCTATVGKCNSVKGSIVCNNSQQGKVTSCVFNYQWNCTGVAIFCGVKHTMSGSHTCACP